MAKAKGPTPTERAAALERSAKAGRSAAKNLREQLAETKNRFSARMRQLKGAATSDGAKKIGTAAAGGFLAGAGTELIVQGALQGTFGEGAAKEYLGDARIAGALTGVLGGVGVVLAQRMKGKSKAMISDIAAGMVAGGAACASRVIVRGILPTSVETPRPAAGLRYAPAYRPAFAAPVMPPRAVRGLRHDDERVFARAPIAMNRAGKL